MQENIFWFVVAVAFLLVVTFALKLKRLQMAGGTQGLDQLGRSQEKDNWLLCAMVWSVALSEHAQFASALQSAGSFLMAWLCWRTHRRIAMLDR